ncbi:LLM class F420-dependent oxidoreductase, partial [Arthrobacter deserti]|nr:LLM class F420-dependent oxidoreductase [Arthrobacter deserti]
PPMMWDLARPEHFDSAAGGVGDDEVRQAVNISASTGRHAAWLQEYLDLGFEELYLHFVGQHQEPFIKTFADEVLPQLR